MLNVADASPCRVTFTPHLAACICSLDCLQTDSTDSRWILTELAVLDFVLFKQIYK